MNLGIGVHENVITTAKFDEKENLVITFTREEEEQSGDFMSSFSNSSLKAPGSGKDYVDVKIFTLQTTDYSKNALPVDRILTNIIDRKNVLTHILVEHGIDPVWNPFEGTNLNTEEEVKAGVTNEGILTMISQNLNNQFVAQMKTVSGVQLKRVVVRRRSTASSYPALRDRFLDNNPFMESMDVETTRVKFTDWEISNGYNSGAQTEKPKVDKTATEAKNKELVANLFGGN